MGCLLALTREAVGVARFYPKVSYVRGYLLASARAVFGVTGSVPKVNYARGYMLARARSPLHGHLSAGVRV
eukprot:2015628-Lingulodinium_polyedra.AAC.1